MQSTLAAELTCYGKTDALLALGLFRHHFADILAVGTLSIWALRESVASLLFMIVIDAGQEADLKSDNDDENLHVRFERYDAADIWGDVDVASLLEHLLDFLLVCGLQLETFQLLFFLFLNFLLFRCFAHEPGFLDIIIVLEVKLNHGALEISKLDFVLNVDHVHGSSSLEGNSRL